VFSLQVSPKSYIGTMKNKFKRALALLIVSAVLFVVSTFVPSMQNSKQGNFFHGFSLGLGVIALFATVYFYLQMKKAKEV